MKIVEGVINTRETVEVIGTKHADPKKQKMIEGKTYQVHPLTAKNLVETGHAKMADEKKGSKK